MSFLLAFIFVQFIKLSSTQSCDKRANGGILLCCKGTNNSCVAVAGIGNQTCYCDEHCLTAFDCCPDYKRCSKFQVAAPQVKTINASVLPEKQQYVRLKCVWEYEGNNSLVEFHVRWIGDEKDQKRQISRIFNSTEKREYLYENEYARKGIPDPRHYTFKKEVFCEIRSRYVRGGNWTNWMRSNKIYTGISVYPQSINLAECGGAKNRKVFITLIPHLPIRNEQFKIDIRNLENGNAVDKLCLRGVESHGACQIHLTNKHSLNTPLRIMMTTSCSQFEGNNGYSSVNVTLKHRVYGNNKFWEPYKFPQIKIFLTKSKKRICKSETDPHFTTFDGRYYDFMGIGTFLLYYNKQIGVRVEARQKSCGGSASCNCGIAMKEGPFYKIFDMCQVDNTKDGTQWWQNPQNLVIRKRGIKDSKTNGFYSLEKSDGSSTTYDVYLPSGVMVTIKRWYWGLSTYIKAPSPFSQSSQNNDYHSQGLCGNFNGNPDDDFYGTEHQFGESNRIHGPGIFSYKGDKILEEKQHEDCKYGEICSCGGNKGVCGEKAIGECFPSEEGKHHSDINAGLCESLTKRSVDSRDDDIDDQDDIPPFNPPQQNTTQLRSWPTPGGLTEMKVKEICNAKIRDSKAGANCQSIVGVDINAVVGQCISDIQAMDNIAWANDNFAALQETCKKNIFKNTSFYKNSTDGELKLDTQFIASLCPNGCSDHGNCSNSTCTCDEDYTAADCSISLKDSPFISGIRKSGLCDVRRRPCRNVGIYGFPFLDSENLTCHVQEFKVIESAWTPSNSIKRHHGKLVDLTEVKCFLPESPVNIGEYDKKGVTAAGLKISVSNNGINASKAVMLFITYDSICQECNTTTGCRLKSDACLISDHCFAQNESHPNNWCKQCLPDISTTSWIERRDNLRPRITTSALLFAFRRKELRVQLRAIDPEYRTIRYSFAQNETFGASLTTEGLFTWTKDSNDSTQFLFKVTDECGAYSVLRASVVITKCLCQNSGECNPDYRFLDGAGNFSCTCPHQYTGTLCEVDVNECIVSKRCFNGSCKNEQPGFSCSCFPGYTGRRCENEIDECASSPCFLGVSCTDGIASFRCGPCPLGYSGSGANCTRIVRENQPPKFTTPSLVYAVLNMDLQIQIDAYDPENQNMTFDVVSNLTTLITARITKQLLTVSNVKGNGTVFIQVQDQMGSKSILVLLIIGIECPCRHKGECYRRQNVTYPVQPSDYSCRCKRPFSGTLCEVNGNSCNELSCYPGLTCASAQNPEGHICEKCPPLFEGNGKECKRKENAEQSSVFHEMTLTNKMWDDRLNNKTSIMYKSLANQLTVEIRKVYKKLTSFSYVIIKGFRRGSVIVEFELIFTKSNVHDPLKALLKAAENGKLGNITFEMTTAQAGRPEDKVFGVDKTTFYVIISGIVLFNLVISSAIYNLFKRHRTSRKARLRRSILTRSNARRIAVQPTDAYVKSDGGQVALKVFDNEALRSDEEIEGPF